MSLGSNCFFWQHALNIVFQATTEYFTKAVPVSLSRPRTRATTNSTTYHLFCFLYAAYLCRPADSTWAIATKFAQGCEEFFTEILRSLADHEENTRETMLLQNTEFETKVQTMFTKLCAGVADANTSATEQSVRAIYTGSK